MYKMGGNLNYCFSFIEPGQRTSVECSSNSSNRKSASGSITVPNDT